MTSKVDHVISFHRWPDIYRMKVRDKNFGIETPSETIYFKMVSDVILVS